MNRFLALYMGTPDGFARWNGMDEAEQARRRKEAFDAWVEWGNTHAVSIVDQGGPIGKTKRADPAGVADTRNAVTGYVIVEAEDHATAARMFERHPHFTLFPGDSVEIMEILPMPGM